MAVTRKQAEGYWEKYNKDKNDVLTAEEVKECLQEVYETVDDQDVAQILLRNCADLQARLSIDWSPIREMLKAHMPSEVQSRHRFVFGNTLVTEKFRFFGQSDVKTLTKDEFVRGIMRTKKCDQLSQQFKELDKDGSGSLSKDELKNGLSSVGIEGEQAEIVLDELAYDSDGKFCFKEFIDVVVFSENFMQQYGGM